MRASSISAHLAALAAIGKAVLIALISQAFISSLHIVDQLFAAQLGAGAISTYNYANRILALILSLSAVAISRATLPVFSRLAAGSHLHIVTMRWARLMFALGSLTVIIAWIAAPWIVSILFERGAFNEGNTFAVTEVLRYSLPQIPFFLAGLIFVSHASSRRLYMLLLWSSGIGLVIKLSANAALTPLLGLNGIALGWTLVYAATAAYLWISVRSSICPPQDNAA